MTQQAIGLQLRSTVKKEGILELSLASVPIPEPKPDEVVVRVEASPINPSDLGLMFAGADLTTAKVSGSSRRSGRHGEHPARGDRSMAGRVDQSLPVGNEGAGVVVRAGSSDEARALMGKTVAILGGAMYAQFRGDQGEPVPRPAAGHHAGGGRLVLREPAHRARHGRDHAPRRATPRSCTPRPPRTSARC